MKLFGFPLRTWLTFAVGFLLGSRAGRGPWDRAVVRFNQLQEKAKCGYSGHVKGKLEEAKGRFIEAKDHLKQARGHFQEAKSELADTFADLRDDPKENASRGSG